MHRITFNPEKKQAKLQLFSPFFIILQKHNIFLPTFAQLSID
jgi:hypothetical protein